MLTCDSWAGYWNYKPAR